MQFTYMEFAIFRLFNYFCISKFSFNESVEA